MDPIVTLVQIDMANRSALGIAKYGTTLARTDLTETQWLQHAYEEALDLALYLRRLLVAKQSAGTVRNSAAISWSCPPFIET